MSHITELLKGDFTIVDLGSSTAKDNPFLVKFFPAITSIEIDALSPGETSAKLFYKNVKINKGIHVNSNKNTFYARKYFQCSSFLRTNTNVVAMYGQENITALDRAIEMECITLPEILQAENINRVDFLKTDLEGLDHAILKSATPYLKDALVVQSELRFQPFYENEPPAFATWHFLHEMGFELITIKPESWKYNTRDRLLYRDGRLVWGDFIFFRKIDQDETDAYKLILKQILLAKSLQLHNHAAYLFETHKDLFPEHILREIDHSIRQRNIADIFITRIFNTLSIVPGYSLVRKMFHYFYKKSAVHARNFPWWSPS